MKLTTRKTVLFDNISVIVNIRVVLTDAEGFVSGNELF